MLPMAILADLGSPSAGYLGNLVMGLGGLATGAAAVKLLFPTRHPPIEGEFLTQKRFEAHEIKDSQEFAALRQTQAAGEQRLGEKLEESANHLNLASERRTADTHKRLDVVVNSLARMEGKMEDHATLKDRLDQLGKDVARIQGANDAAKHSAGGN